MLSENFPWNYMSHVSSEQANDSIYFVHLFQNKTVSHLTNRYHAQNDNTVTSLHLDFSLQRNKTKTSIVQRIVSDDKVRRALVGTELELKLAQNFFSRLSEHNRASKKFFYAQIFFPLDTVFDSGFRGFDEKRQARVQGLRSKQPFLSLSLWSLCFSVFAVFMSKLFRFT